MISKIKVFVYVVLHHKPIEKELKREVNGAQHFILLFSSFHIWIRLYYISKCTAPLRFANTFNINCRLDRILNENLKRKFGVKKNICEPIQWNFKMENNIILLESNEFIKLIEITYANTFCLLLLHNKNIKIILEYKESVFITN